MPATENLWKNSKNSGARHRVTGVVNGSDHYRRSTINFLISAIALAGFRFFGQVRVQFMIVWQR